jgi:hypothetical protein
MVALSLILPSLGICCGCGQAGGNRKSTYPVKGKVLVDGEPVEMLAVVCVRLSEVDQERPTESQCFTQKDGSFTIGTYESGDGVPEGDYALTFRWGQWNLFSHSYEGDKLNGRYTNLTNPVAKFTVKKGQPTDLAKIELTTK